MNIDFSTGVGIAGLALSAIGILIGVFVATKKSSIKISQKNIDGNANMNNNTIANEMYIDKEGKEK